VENWMDGMLAFVLCPGGECRYSEGFPDLRAAPHDCPQCGRALLAGCPHCGMLLRNRWGMCTNCGLLLFSLAAAVVQPTVKLA